MLGQSTGSVFAPSAPTRPVEAGATAPVETSVIDVDMIDTRLNGGSRCDGRDMLPPLPLGAAQLRAISHVQRLETACPAQPTGGTNTKPHDLSSM